MVIACAGTFLVVLDATIVSVALPRTGVSLGVLAGSLAWVIDFDTLTLPGSLLLGGRLCPPPPPPPPPFFFFFFFPPPPPPPPPC